MLKTIYPCSPLEEHPSPKGKEAGSNPVTDIIGPWCNGSIDGSNPFGVGSNPTGPVIGGSSNDVSNPMKS